MYSRKVDGLTLSFEHARFLHQGSFVMYDRESVSLWIHTTGEAVIGDHKGKTLEFLPSTVTTWRKWSTEHPTTLVLNVKQGNNSRFSLRKNPEAGGLSVGQPDEGLKFYPFTIFQEKRLVNDELAGTKIVVVFDRETFAFAAFERDDQTFTWNDGHMVDLLGKLWNPSSGRSGEMALKPIPTVPWLTKAWKRFYPDGVVYDAE